MPRSSISRHQHSSQAGANNGDPGAGCTQDGLCDLAVYLRRGKQMLPKKAVLTPLPLEGEDYPSSCLPINGTRALISVPFPGCETTHSFPPTICALSSIPIRPKHPCRTNSPNR